MPASSLTQEEREGCFVIQHSDWNRALVFLGPDAEKRATACIVASVLDSVGFQYVVEAGYEGPITDTEALYEWLQDNEWLDNWLDNWEICSDARIAGDEE